MVTDPEKLVNPGVIVSGIVLAVPATNTICPPVSDPEGTEIVGSATASVKVVEPLWPPAVAWIVTSLVPTLVGIPDKTPFVERLSPRRSPEATV